MASASIVVLTVLTFVSFFMHGIMPDMILHVKFLKHIVEIKGKCLSVKFAVYCDLRNEKPLYPYIHPYSGKQDNALMGNKLTSSHVTTSVPYLIKWNYNETGVISNSENVNFEEHNVSSRDMEFTITNSMLKKYVVLYIGSFQDDCTIAPIQNGDLKIQWIGPIRNNLTEDKNIEYEGRKSPNENKKVQSRLFLNIKLYCDKNYFGYKCEHYCKADDTLHYYCDENGTKTCNAGFTGVNCEEKMDECKSLPCNNNRTCDGYECGCKNESYGINCEHITPESTENPMHSTATTNKSIMKTPDTTDNPMDSTVTTYKSTMITPDSTDNLTDSTVTKYKSTMITPDTTGNPTDSTVTTYKSTMITSDTTENPTHSTVTTHKSTMITSDTTENPTHSTVTTYKSTMMTPDRTNNPTDSTVTSFKSTMITTNTTENPAHSSATTSKSTMITSGTTDNPTDFTGPTYKSPTITPDNSENPTHSTVTTYKSTMITPDTTENPKHSAVTTNKSTMVYLIGGISCVGVIVITLIVILIWIKAKRMRKQKESGDTEASFGPFTDFRDYQKHWLPTRSYKENPIYGGDLVTNFY